MVCTSFHLRTTEVPKGEPLVQAPSPELGLDTIQFLCSGDGSSDLAAWFSAPSEVLP